MGKTYLITGLTGFVGPHLANLLISQGHSVHGLSRRTNGMETDILDVVCADNYNQIRWHHSDFTDIHILQKIFSSYQFDGVFHLGAQSHPPTSFLDPLGTMRTNVIGTANIVQCISDFQSDCRLMFCSTSEVYGNGIEEGQKINESFVLEPSNPYGVSKLSSDLYIQERISNGYIKGFVTRAFSHTGPRRGKNFSISSDAYQLACIQKHKKTNILKIGNLDSIRVVVDVRDIVNAYYLLMINEASGVFNVCGDTPRKMGDYTGILETFVDTPVTRMICPNLYRPIDIHFQDGDCSKLKGLTGWRPTYSIENTMKNLFDYWFNKV